MFQLQALFEVWPSPTSHADGSASVYDTMPGHAGMRRECGQGIANLACRTTEPGQPGDLPVRCDSAPRNTPHYGVDARVASRSKAHDSAAPMGQVLRRSGHLSNHLGTVAR